VPFDWATSDRLTFTPRKVNVVGAGTTFITPVSAPGILPDGTAVFSHSLTGEVIALQTVADPPTQLWRARPGVRNTAAATFGTTTVVASVNRRLVAYGPDGAWLWDSPLSDLVIVAPVRIGDLVITAGLDGGVAAYDLATGARRWQQGVGSEVRVVPQVSGERVLVADQGGQLTCFDATGATIWTATVGLVEDFGVTTGTDPVVVVPNSDGPRVTGLALSDGRQLWRPRHSVSTKDVVGLANVVVLRDDDETIGVDPVTGEKVWTWHSERSYAGIGGGDRVLLLAADKLVLLDAKGNAVKEWPVQVGDPSTGTSWLAAAQGRVVVLGPEGAAIGVVAP
jgi:outer membrane protein assembly factor BamB